MEVVALPAGGRSEAASDLGGQAEAGAERPRRSRRDAPRLSRAQFAASMALQAVSSGSEADVELPVFFARLCETLAHLVKARRVAFWRLGSDRILTLQAEPFGFNAKFPAHKAHIPFPTKLIDGDDLEIVNGTSPQLDAVWQANGLAGIRSSIALSWRAGGRHIGVLAAYDSRRGFTRNDLWVLHVAATATGLMWRYREAEQKLGSTSDGLEREATARRQLLGNIAAGGDEARRRFASTLHDDSLQLLTAAELQLQRARNETDAAKQTDQLGQLESTLKQVEDSLRRLLNNVSPHAAELPLGLDEAIRMRLEALRASTGIEVDVDLRLPELPNATASTVFKNVSEALANVEKHAHATAIRLSARTVDGGVRVVVSDDGKGFVVAESANVPGHLGLVTMRERALLAGGKCHIESEPGSGAKVEFWIPINQ